jgi:predicted dehydrogenase
MKILILGYSNLVKKRIIPVLKKYFNKIEFSICSVSQKKQNIGQYQWFRNYNDALLNAKADIVYISLPNSLHYFWSKKFLQKNYNVIIDKPATLNLKQAKNLINIAKKKKKLLTEATFFNYHNQISESIKEIKSIKNLNLIYSKFVIPKLPKKNFRNFKKYGGGCLYDMGPYSAALFRLFFNEKISFSNFEVNKTFNKNLNISFSIKIVKNKKTFFTYFSHNGDYENKLVLYTKNKRIQINRVFSPPSNKQLKVYICKKSKNSSIIKKIKKDNIFLKYFIHVLKSLKKQNFKNFYKIILTDAIFREKIKNKL